MKLLTLAVLLVALALTSARSPRQVSSPAPADSKHPADRSAADREARRSGSGQETAAETRIKQPRCKGCSRKSNATIAFKAEMKEAAMDVIRTSLRSMMANVRSIGQG